jgi:multiple antibiotic resistance protein
MTEFFTFAAVTFTGLLPMVDPLGNMPIFASMTEAMPRAAARSVAAKACAVALLTILLFAFFGDDLFELFGISINGLKIVGGIIFFIMGYDMLQARLARTKVSDPPTPDQLDAMDDIAVTPLAIPLLCGPGAMTYSVLRMGEVEGSVELAAFLVAALGIMVATYWGFVSATRIAKFMGPSLSKVVLRLMGLLLMVMAVESFFGGLTPIVRGMLGLEV